MKKNMKMKVDYKFAELPQEGGQIHDAKKDDIVSVSLQVADILMRGQKAEDVKEEVAVVEEEVKDEESEDKRPDFLKKETK